MVSLRRNLFSSYLLLLLGVLLPVVPVFPHHHHEDGRICMKNDVQPLHEEHRCNHEPGKSMPCGHATHGCHHEQSCMEADCLTTHLYRAGKASHITLTAPQTGDVRPVTFKTGLAGTLSLPVHYLHTLPRPYIEALYGVDLDTARGLRAPPSLG